MVPLLVPACVKESPGANQEEVDECPDNPNKMHPGVCGCEADDIVDVLTGIYTCLSTDIDLCPNDPVKTKPGICGCGVADTLGSDGIALCLTQNFDLCPDDPKKTLPGICGCGVEDSIDAATGLASCIAGQLDLCPDDEFKTLPGVCGCGVADTPDEATGIPLCTIEELDFCPSDPNKKKPGICGCNVADNDTDDDGKLDCEETCIENPKKYEPGICGCDFLDTTQNIADNDKDGVPNCLDYCPDNKWKQVDDGCSCDQLQYTLQGGTGCAQIISSAREFIVFRDNWNQGKYEEPTNDMAFILVNDINLGEVLTQETASEWVGVGLEEKPFNAIFLGNHHRIEGIRHMGTIHQNLVFGNDESNDVAIFNYTNQARISDITLDLNMVAKDYAAGLMAHSSGSVIDNIGMYGTVTASSYVGGVIAEANSTSVGHIFSEAEVQANGDYVGGVVGVLSDSQLSNVESSGIINGRKYTGGVVGWASRASRLINIYANGEVNGWAYTGAVAGEISARSSLLNAYTTSLVTCYEAPCALLIAQIDDFSTVKNAYSTGLMDNQISEVEPDNPPEDGDPDDPETHDYSVPVAALIASFGSVDNVVEHLFYWALPELIPIPDEVSEMTMVERPTPFEYVELYPYTIATDEAPSALLNEKLNGVLSCNIGICTLDGYTCTQWSDAVHPISLPDGSGNTISVHLPVLELVD